MLEISSTSIKPDATISFMRINEYRSKRVKMIYSLNFEWNSMTQGIARLTKSRCRYFELEKLDRDRLRSRTTGVDVRPKDFVFSTWFRFVVSITKIRVAGFYYRSAREKLDKSISFCVEWKRELISTTIRDQTESCKKRARLSWTDQSRLRVLFFRTHDI